ncbi:MAG: hypothetical protein ABFC31_07920 [Clostridiaceae bacterium]
MEQTRMLLEQKATPNKTNIGAIVVVFVLLFVLGVALVLSSTSIGLSAAQTAVQNNGGSMDTVQYQFIITSTTQNYQIVGGAIAILSGLGALLGMNQVLKHKIETEK